MKTKIFLISLLTALMLTVGCSRGESLYSGQSRTMALALNDSVEYESMHRGRTTGAAIAMDHGDFHDGSDFSQSADLTNHERKLVKNAFLVIRVDNLEAADASIAGLLERYNSYSASTSISENHYFYSLRVPAPQYDAFLSDMNGIGRLIQRSESTEDVTLRYYDLEGRLESKRELLRTFQSYLGRASNIEEILSVEARIADLQHDIERTGSQLRNLSNRVDYATIDLQLMGPVTSSPIQNITFGERIKQLFGHFGSFLSTVAVILLGFIIYGIPSLALLALLFWVLFGKLGLMKKLWKLVKGKNQTE
ncbi:MAG: DUF4349 domain-containing protein [Treponema sp.]|nr:DUF4349 domain-containing protein [Treponema sp.]